MAYTPDYTADDVSEATIDSGTKILITLGSFAAIFGLLLSVYIVKRIWKKA
jgi:hypothetical protein